MRPRNLMLPLHATAFFVILTSVFFYSEASAQPNLAPAKSFAKQESKKDSGYPSTPYITYQQEVMSFMLNATYQKELEMTEEQKKVVKELNKEMYTGYNEIYQKYPELKDRKLDPKKRSELYKKVQAEYADLKKEIERKLLDQLVPNQRTVLKNLRFQRTLGYYGLSGTLTRSTFAEEFDVSKSQKTELEKIKKETEAEIYKLIQEKRAAARDKMLKVLNAKQRKKLEELKGETKDPSRVRL